VTNEDTIDISEERFPEPTVATSGGLANRFVGVDPLAPPSGPGRSSASTGTPGPFTQEIPLADVAPERVRDGSRLLRIGLVVSTAGLCLLLFLVYVYGFSGLQEHRAQRGLLNQFTAASRVSILSAKVPPEGRPAGVLTIPAIGLSVVVVEGTTATDLT
jgi:hypothetical protein